MLTMSSTVEDARIRPMMGLDILESLLSARIPYALVDPFIFVDEGVVPTTLERAGGKPYGETPIYNGPYVD